jgi:probable HAF family extracellular repeat protein
MNTRIARIMLLLAIFQPFLSPILHGQYIFTITDLGTLGGTTSSATGISLWGQVVGTSTNSFGESRAFVYWNGVMTDLGTLGGHFSSATAINNVGQVVGYATTSSGDSHAFLFQGSTMTDLGTLGGSSSQANAINNYGQIVGSAALANGQTRAFVYYHGAMTDLGALGAGAQSSVATGINNNGEIIGNSDKGPPTAFLGNFPFVFTNGQMSVLSGFANDTADAEYGVAAVNNSGQTVGGGSFSSLEEASSAFIDTAGNVTLFDLPQAFPELPGPYAYAYAINDFGLAVGDTYSNTYRNGAYQAMIYYQGLTADINSLVNLTGTNFVNLDHAYGISNTGQIVGSGTTKDGSSHAYLLTLIPAPSP